MRFIGRDRAPRSHPLYSPGLHHLEAHPVQHARDIDHNPSRKTRHLLRQHRQRNLREHFQRPETPSRLRKTDRPGRGRWCFTIQASAL